MNLNVGFGPHNATKENVVLEVARPGGLGVLFNLHVGDEKFITSNTHIHYMR